MSRIRNRVGFRERVRRLQGWPVDQDLRRFDVALDAINSSTLVRRDVNGVFSSWPASATSRA